MYIKDTGFLYINLSHFLSIWKVWLLSALRKKKKKKDMLHFFHLLSRAYRHIKRFLIENSLLMH